MVKELYVARTWSASSLWLPPTPASPSRGEGKKVGGGGDRETGRSCGTVREGEIDAAVLLALVLDLADQDGSDLAGARDMRPAAGLEVHAFDLEQTHLAMAAGRLDRHGADQLRLGGELLVGDPARPDRMVLGDQLVERGLDRGAVRRFWQIEVEPSL